MFHLEIFPLLLLHYQLNLLKNFLTTNVYDLIENYLGEMKFNFIPLNRSYPVQIMTFLNKNKKLLGILFLKICT